MQLRSCARGRSVRRPRARTLASESILSPRPHLFDHDQKKCPKGLSSMRTPGRAARAGHRACAARGRKRGGLGCACAALAARCVVTFETSGGERCGAPRPPSASGRAPRLWAWPWRCSSPGSKASPCAGAPKSWPSSSVSPAQAAGREARGPARRRERGGGCGAAQMQASCPAGESGRGDAGASSGRDPSQWWRRSFSAA